MGEDSIMYWLERLNEGDDDSAYQIWDHCFDKLLRIAKRRLGDLPNRSDDEEDLALSAFNSLCRGAREGRFRQLKSNNDLWQILVMITSRKAANRMKYHLAEKRGGGKVRGDSAFGKKSQSGSMRIEEAAAVDDAFGESLTLECREMIESLGDETLKQIAILRLERYTNREIAEKIERAESTVDLKLKLIRQRWGRTSDSKGQ